MVSKCVSPGVRENRSIKLAFMNEREIPDAWGFLEHSMSHKTVCCVWAVSTFDGQVDVKIELHRDVRR